MEKIYAIIDQNNIVINTILLDLTTSNWVPESGWIIKEAVTDPSEPNASIGDLYIDGKFSTVLKPEDSPQIDTVAKLQEFLINNPDVAELLK